MRIDEEHAVIDDLLGPVGRLLSGSKSGYLENNPSHKVFFNGNIFNSGAWLLWYGDIDLNLDAEKLQKLANQLNECLYVTSENPYRWESPDIETLEADIKRNANHPRVIKVVPNETSGQSEA